MTDENRNIWQQLGLSDGAGGHLVRLGRGVLGKTGPQVLAGLAVLALIALRLTGTTPLLILGGAVCVLLLVYLALAFGFAFRNPGAALLEGADLLRWQSLINPAAKDPPALIDAQVISNPFPAPEPVAQIERQTTSGTAAGPDHEPVPAQLKEDGEADA